MWIKLRFFEQNYNIEEGNSVECKVNVGFRLDTFVPLIGLNFRKISKSFPVPTTMNVDDGYLHFEVTGISKCHPQDKWDLVKGKRIAESKAKDCAYRIAENILRICATALKDAAAKMMANGVNRLLDLAETEHRHVLELSK